MGQVPVPIVLYSLFNASLTYGIKVIYTSRWVTQLINIPNDRHGQLNLVLMVENFKIRLAGSEKQLIVFYICPERFILVSRKFIWSSVQSAYRPFSGVLLMD